MNDRASLFKQAMPKHWSKELDALEACLNEAGRGVNALEGSFLNVASSAAHIGNWATVFEAWATLARRYEEVTEGEALTIWASPERCQIDFSRCQPPLDFRSFEADLVLGIWPALRWGETGNPPDHSPADCETAWLSLWQTMWQAAASSPAANEDMQQETDTEPSADTAQIDPEFVSALAAYTRLAAAVFAPRRGDEGLGMPARWRLSLLRQVRAFEAAALGAPGSEALARPDSRDPEAGRVIAASCITLFHHSGRGLGSGLGRGRVFREALRDLLTAPLPEAADDAWGPDAERSLERLFRFWAAGEPALCALFEGWLDFAWGDTRAALPVPNAPRPQNVVERIALVGGPYVGKSSFLFGSEELRGGAANGAGADTRLPIIRHAWLQGRSEAQRIASRRSWWRKGEQSETAIADMIATTGIHDFQAFEIVDLQGESLLPKGDDVMDYAMQDIFRLRPPAALALMIDTSASLSPNDLESVKRLLALAFEAHGTPPQAEPMGSNASPVPPVYLIANKADRFLIELREERFGTATKIQRGDGVLLDLLCERALDLGLLLRRAAHSATDGDGRNSSIQSLVMKEALEAKVLSANPTIGIAVDHLLERESALMSALLDHGATDVALNFTCSAAPEVLPEMALAGIRAFWNEIWGWARTRRAAALAVQRDAFVVEPEKDRDLLHTHLARSALALPFDALLQSIDDVSVQAQSGKNALADRLEAVGMPTSPDAVADWLKRSGNEVLHGLGEAVDAVETLAAEADQSLKLAVDQVIHGLVKLLGVEPHAKIESLDDLQLQGSIISEKVSWLEAMQREVAVDVPREERVRRLPKLIAADRMPSALMQAEALLDALSKGEVEGDGENEALDLLRHLVAQRIAAATTAENLERACPGGPEGNPRLFHRINGALLDDCFWKNEPWRSEHKDDAPVNLILSKPESSLSDLLIELAGQPRLDNKTEWSTVLAPLLRLLAEFEPVFPQLAMKRYESDAHKAVVLDRLRGRRRVELLIAALEASLTARALLHSDPSFLARVQRLVTVDVMLPALQSLGFDAQLYEDAVRLGSAAARSNSVSHLTSIQQSVDAQLVKWPGLIMSLTGKSKKKVQEVRAEVSDLRNQLKDPFGGRILPTLNNENPKLLRQAMKRLQLGEKLLDFAAGETRHTREALSDALQGLSVGVREMRKAVDRAEKAIHTDILVERYERFLELRLENYEHCTKKLEDGFGVTDGGIFRREAKLDQLHKRYFEAMWSYFDECAESERQK